MMRRRVMQHPVDIASPSSHAGLHWNAVHPTSRNGRCSVRRITCLPAGSRRMPITQHKSGRQLPYCCVVVTCSTSTPLALSSPPKHPASPLSFTPCSPVPLNTVRVRLTFDLGMFLVMFCAASVTLPRWRCIHSIAQVQYFLSLSLCFPRPRRPLLYLITAYSLPHVPYSVATRSTSRNSKPTSRSISLASELPSRSSSSNSANPTQPTC
jgi:hypothetical protein